MGVGEVAGEQVLRLGSMTPISPTTLKCNSRRLTDASRFQKPSIFMVASFLTSSIGSIKSDSCRSNPGANHGLVFLTVPQNPASQGGFRSVRLILRQFSQQIARQEENPDAVRRLSRRGYTHSAKLLDR